HTYRSLFVGAADDVIDLALLVTRATDDDRARDVGAIAACFRAEVEQQKVAALDATRGRSRMWQRRTRTRRHDRWKGKPFTSLVTKRLLEHTGNLELRHAGVDLRQGAPERTGRDAVGVFDERDLVAVLPLAKHLDNVDRRTPLPARSRVEQSLKITMQQVAGFETRDLDVAEQRELLPQAGPEALPL